VEGFRKYWNVPVKVGMFSSGAEYCCQKWNVPVKIWNVSVRNGISLLRMEYRCYEWNIAVTNGILSSGTEYCDFAKAAARIVKFVLNRKENNKNG
jgi:hypothetical protein